MLYNLLITVSLVTGGVHVDFADDELAEDLLEDVVVGLLTDEGEEDEEEVKVDVGVGGLVEDELEIV